MAKRLPDETDKMKVPGPGSYESGDIDMCREKQPAFTMAPKTSLPTDRSPKPAPNAYSPEKVGMRSSWEFLKRRCGGLARMGDRVLM